MINVSLAECLSLFMQLTSCPLEYEDKLRRFLVAAVEVPQGRVDEGRASLVAQTVLPLAQIRYASSHPDTDALDFFQVRLIFGNVCPLVLFLGLHKVLGLSASRVRRIPVLPWFHRSRAWCGWQHPRLVHRRCRAGLGTGLASSPVAAKVSKPRLCRRTSFLSTSPLSHFHITRGLYGMLRAISLPF